MPQGFASCHLRYTQVLEWHVELESFEAIDHVELLLDSATASLTYLRTPMAQLFDDGGGIGGVVGGVLPG